MTAVALAKADTEEWHAKRRQGITATDITVIAGLVTWDSPWALYHRKRGDLPEVEQTDRMRLGSWLEEHIIAEWEGRHFFTEAAGGREHMLYGNEARPWQLATPDLTGHGWVLEAKSTGSREGWGEDGTADVPPRVRAQVLWQMDTLDVAEGHVAVVFTHSGEFRSYTIRHDQRCATHGYSGRIVCQVCQDIEQLRELGREFQKRIMDGDPPPVDGLSVTTDALKTIWPATEPRPAVISPELLEGWDMSRQIAREAKADHDRIANELRELMGNADHATCDGETVFRRSFVKVAGHTVAPYERDTIKRVKAAGDD